VTTLASHLSTFLREYLPRDRAASTHTCETYAYSLMLLLRFAAERLQVPDKLMAVFKEVGKAG
jgi:hypothetical protein